MADLIGEVIEVGIADVAPGRGSALFHEWADRLERVAVPPDEFGIDDQMDARETLSCLHALEALANVAVGHVDEAQAMAESEDHCMRRLGEIKARFEERAAQLFSGG